MFQKLRIQLTIFNLATISALLLVVALAIFIGSPSNDLTNVSQDMLEAALTGRLPEEKLIGHGNRQGGLARLVVDSSGEITEISSALALDEADYLSLAERILSLPAYNGIVALDDGRQFVYLRIALKPTDDPVLVIQQVATAAQSLLGFVVRVSPVLCVLLLLVLFASLAMTQRALVPIKKAWQRQADFTANASHELRTPLAVIQTNLECATGDPAETIGENEIWFENIRSETSRMAKLVNDLLTLSREDNGQQAITKTELFYDVVLQDVIKNITPYTKEKGVALQSDIRPGLMLNGDREQLNRLAVILLDNAIKYTPAGGTVRISACRSERNITLKVFDTGTGIAQEDINKIFDRFYRVEAARTSDIEGSGLGLSLAKWIVTEHMGRITVESEMGHGSEFTVILPAAGSAAQ